MSEIGAGMQMPTTSLALFPTRRRMEAGVPGRERWPGLYPTSRSRWGLRGPVGAATYY